MAVKRIKLANVVVDPVGFLSHASGLSFRPEGKSWGKFDALRDCLALSGTVDFTTYFNGLPVAKWREYCGVRSARLHLELSGDDCVVEIISHKVISGRVTHFVVRSVHVEASEEYQSVDLDISFADAEMMGFRLVSDGVCRLRDSYYYALVDDSRLNDVHLALCMVAYDKDLASIPNLHALLEGVYRSGEPAADHMQVLLINQEDDSCAVRKRKTIDAMVDEMNFPEGAVRVIRTPVLGTSGFVARSILEADLGDEGFTHLFIVGRNYKIHPETVNRLYVMLSLLVPDYALSVICGGTFRLNDPSVQRGDIFSISSKSGVCEPVKSPLDFSRLDDTVLNEAIEVDCQGAYAPWRSTCVPVPLMIDQGYPLPMFIHCDDVEYGIRSNPRCLSMSGIGCWDVDRASRLGEEINRYQYVRNMLVTNAVHGFFSWYLFMWRYWRTFRIFLRYLDYASAELWLDGLDDYLKGPWYLQKLDGQAKFQANAHKDVRLVPVSELSERLASRLEVHPEWLKNCESPNSVRRFLETLPHDPHFLPDFVFRKNAGIVGLHGNSTPWIRTAFCNKLVALDESGSMGYMRTMDRKRYRELHERAEELRILFANTGAPIACWYQDMFRKLTSSEYWMGIFSD